MTITLSLLILWWIFFGSACAYAFLRGGAPERTGAMLMFVASVLTIVGATPFSERFTGVEQGLFTIDLALFCALIALAIYADRFWPLWTAGFHLMSVMAPIAYAVAPTGLRYAYALAQGFFAYPAVLAMVVGVATHQRTLRRHGADNSWMSFSAR